MWKRHPKALPFLFFTEMWERFGYYLMIGIFTLYLKDVETGYAMTEAESADLYGTFIALVYFTPFIGGLLADRFLGFQRSIIIGAIMMGIGYSLMSIHQLPMLYLSMALVIIGNGFFKPNMSAFVGHIYNKPELSHQKDEGYNIFYMGANFGAFICNFIGAVVINIYGWHYAFLAAGIGMFIGVGIYISGRKHYKVVEYKIEKKPADMPLKKIFLYIVFPSIAAGVLGWLIPGALVDTDSTDSFIFASIPVLVYYTMVYNRAEKTEKKQLKALFFLFGTIILFWAVFKQNGSALNTWADNYTNREVKGNTREIFDRLIFAKTVSYKMDTVPLYDNHFRLQKSGKQVLYEYDYPPYFKNAGNDNLPTEGETVSLWNTNLSQSINPGWVVLLTPLIVALFAWMRRRNKEPSTATKIAWGLSISAFSALVMVAAAYAGNNGTEKVSVLWLLGSYGVITVGELLLSPMGLSIVSKLSPVRIAALMMGGWYVSISIGNKISGVLATMWDKYDIKANYFFLNFLLLSIAAILVLMQLKWLNKVLKK